MNPSLKKQLFRTFVQMVADLKDKNEIESFLSDFFVDEELDQYIKRISIAYWLKEGRDEENIKRNFDVPFKEIFEIKRMMKKDGFKLALKKMEAEEWADVWAEKIRKIVK